MNIVDTVLVNHIGNDWLNEMLASHDAKIILIVQNGDALGRKF